MGDLDVTRAGGATGALKRAAQLANQRAANANRVANALRRKQQEAQARQDSYNRNQRYSNWGGGRVLPAKPMPRKLPPPPKMGPAPKQARTDELLGLVDRPTDNFGNPIQGPGVKPPKKVIRDGYDSLGNPVDQFGNALQGPGIERRTGNPTDEFGNTVQGPGLVGAPSFTDLTPAQKKKAHNTAKTVRETGKVTRTVNEMLESLKRDPIKDGERIAAGQELAEAFRDQSRSKYFTLDDLTENPILATLNEMSAWADYRSKVADWKNKKNKGGTVGLEGDPGEEEGGDGTFTGIVDNGSFQSVTSPSNLSPYLVTRDESGLLTVVNADQWIQAKFARMRHDPEYAAQMITALAMTSAYGSDSSANNQRSRVVVDRNGNPIKAFVSSEDLNALKQLANQVAILQNQGDEVAIDDSIAELTAMAAQVGAETTANGDYGSDGGGYGGGGWGGGGGYGGGGGGGQSVQLTDATELTSLVGSIARQRMGRELTPEESAAFVQYYHSMERTESANYYAGGEFTRLDPEGQAVAWVTSKFEEEAAVNQYGNLAADFITMMGGSNPFSGIAG